MYTESVNYVIEAASKEFQEILNKAKGNDPETVVMIRRCPACYHMKGLIVEREPYETYINTDKHVTDVFPDKNVFEREFMMTGYCPECQAKIFGSRMNKYKLDKFL